MICRAIGIGLETSARMMMLLLRLMVVRVLLLVAYCISPTGSIKVAIVVSRVIFRDDRRVRRLWR